MTCHDPLVFTLFNFWVAIIYVISTHIILDYYCMSRKYVPVYTCAVLVYTCKQQLFSLYKVTTRTNCHFM